MAFGPHRGGWQWWEVTVYTEGWAARLVGAASPIPKGRGFDPMSEHLWEATD